MLKTQRRPGNVLDTKEPYPNLGLSSSEGNKGHRPISSKNWKRKVDIFCLLASATHLYIVHINSNNLKQLLDLFEQQASAIKIIADRASLVETTHKESTHEIEVLT